MADPLHCFCVYWISSKLLNCGDVQSCLLSKKCGLVKFCDDFVPDHFQRRQREDRGERRLMAEELLSKMRLENSYHSQLVEYIQSLKLEQRLNKS
ncbi:MAG: hypothetical protein QXZ02_00570 [Candidatus Bathyarchaeia archaeon]